MSPSNAVSPPAGNASRRGEKTGVGVVEAVPWLSGVANAIGAVAAERVRRPW
nr:hypothetical protein [Halobacterium salinarum]